MLPPVRPWQAPSLRCHCNPPQRRRSLPQTPTSLQWFLEVYPALAPADRPLELVQRPGETVFVPAGAPGGGGLAGIQRSLGWWGDGPLGGGHGRDSLWGSGGQDLHTTVLCCQQR